MTRCEVRMTRCEVRMRSVRQPRRSPERTCAAAVSYDRLAQTAKQLGFINREPKMTHPGRLKPLS